MTKNISNCLSMTSSTQTSIWVSYDGRYNNQGLETKQLRNSTLDIFPAPQEHLSMHQVKIGRAATDIISSHIAKFLQIWSTIAGYYELCVGFSQSEMEKYFE